MDMIKMEGISKSFGSVFANRNVNFSVNSGEIHALLGENGAGKSTLMNILSGIYSPDAGDVYIRGEKVKIKSPKESMRLRIGMIHQHFKLVDVLTAKENIIAGQKGSFMINGKKLSREIKGISQKFGLDIDPDKRVCDMSVGEKQATEILKVLYRGTHILIMDEPTAVLTPQETEKLFGIMKKMKESGRSIIMITHKLNEVMEVCDNVTVMRDGETVGTVETKDVTPKILTEMMVGGPRELSIKRAKTGSLKEILNVKNLSVNDSNKIPVLNNVSFSLRRGEILGVAGVAGSGQKELCEAIAGLVKVESGEIIYKDENIVGKSPREIIRTGISMSFIPEDRLGMGLVASMDMVDNLILKEYQTQKGIFVDRNPAREKAHKLIERLDIKTPGVSCPISRLSGGNIQKVLLGREIDSEPQVLITAYPTRGLDIRVTHTIYDLLSEQKEKDVAILYIGEDLDVLMELCDRILVLCGGVVTGIVDPREVSKNDIGLMLSGADIRPSLRREGTELIDG